MAQQVPSVPSNAGNSSSAAIQPSNNNNNHPLDVIVLDTLHQQEDEKLNYDEDFWLSTVDGRYGSMPIPVRVGHLGELQTFYVRC